MTDIVLKRAEAEEVDAAAANKKKKQKHADKQAEPEEKDKKDDSWPWLPKITLSGLLNAIDGVSGTHRGVYVFHFFAGRWHCYAGGHGLVFVMTTNHKNKLDPALLRAGEYACLLYICVESSILNLDCFVCR